MTTRRQYQVKANGRKAVAILPWALVFAGMGLLGWIFLQSSKSPVPSSSPTRSPAPVKPAAPVQGSVPRAPAPQLAAPPKIASPAPPASVVPTQVMARTVSLPSNSVELVQAPKVPVFDERILRAQLALVRHGISPGSIDGIVGSQTRAAIRAFQRHESLPVTGAFDTATWERLGAPKETPLAQYTVTAEDLAQLQPVGKTWLAKSQQDRLDYETILEMLAEKSQSHPDLIKRINPELCWAEMPAGTVVKLPRPCFPTSSTKAAFILISLSSRTLEAYDEHTNLLAHFPCSIGRKAEQRPTGELRIAAIAHNPNYTFDPDIFQESAEARELGHKLILPPGPNNPVGTVWIGLDRPGYGIHGTPRPEQVGRTESHGCFRLANWNAEYLARLVWVGLPIQVEP